jgi:tRNA dimethylallyltransferase
MGGPWSPASDTMTSNVVSADSLVLRALELYAEDPDAMLAIVGPTASGKTELAVLLAERLRGEIVSADSVQVYRRFDIGSGKPSAEERARAPHHLIDVIEPLEPIDAASYCERASRAIAEVRARGRVPILCGGTFLWTKALLYGLAEVPAASEEVRSRHRQLAETAGRPELHARLRTVDPASARRLHPNDFVRVSRALEVHELTGRPLSTWQAEHAFLRPRFPARLVAIAHEPAQLTLRVQARVAAWLTQGWIEETEELLRLGYEGARAMASVGYREIRAHLAGRLPRDELAPAIVRATRVFARRQRTWLNHVDVRWLVT